LQKKPIPQGSLPFDFPSFVPHAEKLKRGVSPRRFLSSSKVATADGRHGWAAENLESCDGIFPASTTEWRIGFLRWAMIGVTIVKAYLKKA
jgi:hypothetical protein